MIETGKLPNLDSAWVEEKKVKEYLLNVEHRYGGPKAEYFIPHGFALQAWEIMQSALVTQGTTNAVVRVVNNPYGKRYTVVCTCPTPDGKNPCIRSVWEINEEDQRPRLITAHAFK